MQNSRAVKYGLPLALSLATGVAQGHVSVISDTAYAESYYEVTLAIPHGCDGADTESVEVVIPDAMTSVTPFLDFTEANIPVVIEKDEASGAVTKLTFERSETADSDSTTYTVSFRGKLGDVPFTTQFFPTTQYCVGGGVSAWVGASTSHDHGSTTESTELPAPSLFVYPARHNGWNQYTAPDHLHDMSIFDDAEIVWKGTAGYSANPVAMELIEGDEDSSVLSEIHTDESFWVKY
ncbi:Uncharacterised protein [Zhongshania aliphaticivorans]|uniref:YncI copper-binding domain-containing protein n=1 Tax=Zhongshania aliphaticivorans TaxID=1470434 RepID=A0A5S9NK93_9GAMM|nr:DUF1775 domain-containing protein [Zhongshania aliphaticivorans]CAA0090362.1 Uncharacterised protein [Zhongshania aliphaticivorans]CAA0097799.1 Uncharacterised protein [Zhongshania aliphaticivorans]